MRTSIRLLCGAAVAVTALAPAGAHATVCHAQPELSTWFCVTGEEDPYYGPTCVAGVTPGPAQWTAHVCTPG